MTKRRNLIAPAIALGVLFTALAVLYFEGDVDKFRVK